MVAIGTRLLVFIDDVAADGSGRMNSDMFVILLIMYIPSYTICSDSAKLIAKLIRQPSQCRWIMTRNISESNTGAS